MVDQRDREQNQRDQRDRLINKTPETSTDDPLIEASKILKEYGGRESNIPIDHEYWTLMNKFRQR